MDKLKLGLEILKCLNKSGFEAYIVGGAVRDYLLKKNINDVDITTNALPEEIASIFPNVTMEGHAYLGCRILMEDVSFEVTTYRKDLCYKDHRHPITERSFSLIEDLKRRDFTINAIVMDQNRKIIDMLNGIPDLSNKMIKTIGPAKTRFEEDGLRVLRAVDFSSRLNFALHQDILDSFQIDYVSKLKEEYILSMLVKIMNEPYQKGLEYIKMYQLLRAFPFYQVVAEEALSYQVSDGFVLFACLHGFLPANVKLSNKQIQEAMDISVLVRNHFDDRSLYKIDRKYWAPAIDIFSKLMNVNKTIDELEEQYSHLPIHSLKEIHFDFNKLPSSLRACTVRKIETAILSREIPNESVQIEQWINKKGVKQ